MNKASKMALAKAIVRIRRQSAAVLVAVVIAGIGTFFLAQSRAATYTVVKEAESGTISGSAVPVGLVPGVSGTGSVAFGSTPGGTGNNRPTVVGNRLLKGPTGAQIKMDGVAVWGIRDQITGDFGTSQYTNRQKIVNNIKQWGANHIRFRVLASDYDTQAYMTKAQQIQQIKDWRDATVAAGMYFQVTWWDSLDGAYGKGNWASRYASAFPMMTDVVRALGDDPMVFYEPFNEPTDAPSDDQWLTAMKATVGHFRTTLSYKGILLIDPRIWSHGYNDSTMTQLEQHDAAQTGMNSKHQLIFAKHDYANEGFPNPDAGFDSNRWAVNGGPWNFTKHLVWQTEFGNYNGDPSSVHQGWSRDATKWMAAKVNDGTLVGATAFLYGPWYDANAMTNADNTTPNIWGGYVRDNLLRAVN